MRSHPQRRVKQFIAFVISTAGCCCLPTLLPGYTPRSALAEFVYDMCVQIS